MWWLAIFWMQDAGAQQPQQVRAAMAASIEKQRASIAQQLQFIKSPVPPAIPASFSVPPPVAYACEPVAQPELSKMIDSVARQHSVDPALVREVARQESGFRPCAVSPKGAEGLMQLMPATQAQLEVRDPFDPQESLSAGAKLLKQLLDRYNGDLALALSAYNAGITRVDRTFSVPEIPETQGYVTNILGRLGK
ncbi:MAG TPA: lytic transglycosylase domain-containing protein [Bryobacteraceae bacterium]|jgi:soluble lytic murein transglycosylase-like protein|nr:lytic transglycosylase domain-containing protein [Bryobacteraceae bacterium]